MQRRLGSIFVGFVIGCGGVASPPGGTTSVPPRTRLAMPASEPLMLGIATVTDGSQGFSNVFFFNVAPTTARCAPVDVPTGRGAICTVRDCRTDEPGSLPTRLIDVGEISVTSPPHPTPHSRPGADGLYALDGDIGLRWTSGDAVHIANSGGPDAAAVSAELVVPIQPHLLAPAAPADERDLVVSRGMPLEVRWDAFDGVAHVFLAQVPLDVPFWLRHIEVECLVDGADGALDVPVEILERFASGDGYGANFSLGARVWQDVDVEGRTLRFVAQTGRSIPVSFE